MKDKLKVMGLTLVLAVVMGVMSMMTVNAEDGLQGKIDNLTKGEVVLDKNYTVDGLKIAKGQDVTIDLNGYTLTTKIKVNGKLTLTSSKTGGTVVGNGEANTSAIEVGEDEKGSESVGEFTLVKNVTIKNDTGYGVYCMNGSTAYVKGGSIETFYSPLTGNNTTGAMNFVVSGGSLKALKGPAIYMPGPIDLTITGGTLDGGIGLRMGNVNISGGTINAATTDLDDIKDYYNKSGNIWLADALFVFGGTYKAGSGYNNDLNLNITGGTFNTTNGKGSGIAIYDIGKEVQNMKVNISSKALVKTNAVGRNAYDVLSLKDMGVTNPSAGYGVNSGKVQTTITGGSFSSSVRPYLDQYYQEKEEGSLFVVSKKEIAVDVPSIDKTSPVKTIKYGIENISNIQDILIASLMKNDSIDVTDVTPLIEVNVTDKKESDVDSTVKESIDKALTDKSKNLKVANYFDISIAVKNKENDDYLGSLDKLTEKVKFAVAIPDSLLKTEDGYERHFYVVRVHGDKTDILDTKLDKNIVTFESDKFSTYALAYEDVKKTAITNPETGDNIIIFGGLLVLGLAGMVVTYKKFFN